jgi:hypothetical protein
MTRSARDFTIYTNVPPKPFGTGPGIPDILEVDLKKKGPYTTRKGAFGAWIITEVKPK